MIPIIGGGVFILLYVIATLFYPGGSNQHPNEIGFNWLTNFWCDLTGSIAKNGQKNNAQPIALVAMLVLCLVCSVFSLYLQNYSTQTHLSINQSVMQELAP